MKKIINTLRLGIIFSTLLTMLLLTGCVNVPSEIKHPVNFPDQNYDIYARDITGISYGWKLFSCIPVGHPKYTNAIDEIWKKSELPMSQRKGYTQVIALRAG
jgi:hypothetical protein